MPKGFNAIHTRHIEVDDTQRGIQIRVSDNGIGIKKELLRKIPRMNHALSNLAERLKLFYNKENLMQIFSEDKKGTEVRILLPGNKND